MNALDGILDELNRSTFETIEQGLKPIIDRQNGLLKYFEKLKQFRKDYEATGAIPPTEALENWEEVDSKRASKKSPKKSSIKENVEPQENQSRASGRPKRTASRACTQAIYDQINLPLNTKLRRSKNTPPTQNVFVKLEKLSICPDPPPTENKLPEDQNVKVKKEVVDMPAPSRPAPRKKKQRGPSKVIKEEKVEEIVIDSDVIVKNVITPIVILDSSSDTGDETSKSEPGKTRSTRTRTIKKHNKRSRSSSEHEERQKEKRSRSIEDEDENATNGTVYEDAVSKLTAPINDTTFVASTTINEKTLVGPNQTCDTTFVASKEAQVMNATVVVENPKYGKDFIPQSVSDLMTDDESYEEVKAKQSPKSKRAIPRAIKQVFSPFDQSPVKKKVQAFEKLKDDASTLPTRTTRTKTRALAKQEDAVEAESATVEPKSNVKEKMKVFTPAASKFLPKAASTTAKSRPAISSASNESLISSKSASALKASQAEYRERERRRREKEEEALKKRDALIQAQIEEKKRKREEKQLKAQQQREALEKEKLKALEAQKLKDERHKQLLAEQEERKIKQKEELEKKRQLAKMKAIEEKKKEERKLEEQEHVQAKQIQYKKTLPLYMRTQPPLLPTDDCYDSDDERYEKRKVPEWTKEKNLMYRQKIDHCAGEAIKNTFFSVQAQTPDLQDIFVVIAPEKLKRTSSAMWHKRPRFTMIPGLESHDETEEFDEDFE